MFESNRQRTMSGTVEERQLHVLDLPQLYDRPNASELLHALSLIRAGPSSFGQPESANNSCVLPEGIPNYLTSIIASTLSWFDTEDDRDAVWEAASLCLAERSGRSAQPAMTRTFHIPLNGENVVAIDIHEPAYTSDNIGMKTWSSSYALAKQLHMIPPPPSSNARRGSNEAAVLELGAGTGVSGIAAALVWGNAVYLTDLPAIEPNTARNIEANREIIEQHEGGQMCSGILDWSCPEKLQIRQHDGTFTEKADCTFNTILVADPLYSEEHPKLLANAIRQTCVRGVRDARVIIALPLRDGYSSERQELARLLEDLGLIVTHTIKASGHDDWGPAHDLLQVDYEICTWQWR